MTPPSEQLACGSPARVLALAAVAASSSAAGVARARRRRPPTRWSRRVDGTPITEGDLAVAAQEFGEQLAQVPPEQRRATLLQIV